eukprot:CAMPEP_0113636636 /NCGR_PEP_ID=MMETSP0017_2-20120614/19132_1 /TAXON_ID=2856 /ORGANISM="Cylindrotheca closterium" /LENGTH=934 /DNA_ID=CAMNT_0000547537 /DNA_START=34 /DNA_END=2835 /DNA_ORIENTATION=+ /assembly_acc=CAM_ASM_000147
MVTETIKEAAEKSWDWYNSRTPKKGSFSNTSQPLESTSGQAKSINSLKFPELGQDAPADQGLPDQDLPASTKYWNLAQNAAENTYSTVSGLVSSVSFLSGDSSDDRIIYDNGQLPLTPSNKMTPSLLTSPVFLNMFQNPYTRVRGLRGADKPSSMDAVRTLLSVTAPDVSEGGYYLSSPRSESDVEEEDYNMNSPTIGRPIFETPTAANTSKWMESSSSMGVGFFFGSPPTRKYTDGTDYSNAGNAAAGPRQITSRGNAPSETASQLAEGTLRAFRDIALDEAVELHSALRYWSYRWERPLLSWLEAGPTVWFSDEGYQHQLVGQKVSQIQAVLARRCVTIGDLQQHLLRSGWQQGVAKWGVLGDGGDFATVAGFDGRMPVPEHDSSTANSQTSRFAPRVPRGKSSMTRVSSELSELPLPPPPSTGDMPRQTPASKAGQLPNQRRHSSIYYTDVSVRNTFNGQIVVDNPALAEWSVDAMSLVRHQLYRACNGRVTLPFVENWAQGDDQSLSYASLHNFVDDSTAVTNESIADKKLPSWATVAPQSVAPGDLNAPSTDQDDDAPNEEVVKQRVAISDLPMMVQEVAELLDVMEGVMQIQRSRRLEKLKEHSKIRRSWYVVALAVPSIAYFMFKTRDEQYGMGYLKYAAQLLVEFCQEHVVSPFWAIYDELTSGRAENISDHQARDIVVENLQKMIRAWLDEAYPDMPEQERARKAVSMDVSLIENQKEASMKTIYELNSVIRLSFIEAQFIKKEMMNALLALDDMRASTNFNLNMAAVTPFVLLMYLTKRAFQFVFYATLKLGKSREETYGNFLHILTEIERLLNIRDAPPQLLFQAGGYAPNGTPADHDPKELTDHMAGDRVLSTDDLGMLMLHIHALRTILWRDQRRFSTSVIRSVAEDLSELAGERGAVSVRQQLQIVARMHRTYPFLKIVG